MELGILNEPFDAVRLRNEDYIPFQAVLFDRKFLAGGVRFDERLHVYEDWDFLLQLAQQTRFFHVDRVSAFCRASATPEADAGSDEVAKRQARGVVFDKWKAMGTGPQVDEPIDSHALAQRTLLQRQLAQLRNELDALHDQLREKNSELAGRLAQVTGLKNQCADQEVIINELRDKLVDSEHSARASNALVQEVFSSTSWAVARPIRWVGIRARTFKQSLKRWLSGNSLISLPTSALGVPSIVRRQDGTYELAHDEGRYTYVEPQQPPDMVDQLAKVSERTVFSIVVPVYNTPVALLEAAVRSVREQWYPNWRLILVDDASTSSDTSDALSRIDEPKIQLIRLGSNQGIAGATNAGLEAAKGDFIVFMDHDDELTPDCLYELALCIEREQGDFVYSDEDKLDESGNFTQPHFKPDWSPDTMMSTMFTGHVSCVRRSLLAAIGGLRSEFNGCQDWDFVLRVSELTQRISHVPKVLYHWRIIPASVASDIAAKPYVLDASRRVRMAALERRGLDGEIEPVTQVPGYFRVNYHLRGLPRISIIIPTRDGGNVLRVCIDSILAKSSYRNFEIVILDNGSTDSATIDYLQAINGTENIRVIRHDKPFNFSELNNIGAGQATGQLLLFLNDDAEVVSGDWMERMGGFALLPHVGAVGAKLIYPKTSTIQHAGVINLASGPAHAFSKGDAEMPGYFMRNLLEYNWLAVTGACMMIEKAKFDSLGGFDARFPIAYNDIELCIRAVNQGLFNVVCQAVTMIHHESISRGLDHKDLVKANRLQGELRRLFDKHPAYFQYDPFHNPNLDPEGLNFEVSM
jgi:GT2 family glycosyltransferase